MGAGKYIKRVFVRPSMSDLQSAQKRSVGIRESSQAYIITYNLLYHLATPGRALYRVAHQVVTLCC